MYSGCDTLSLQILFVYFLALSSLLHPSILIVFYTCCPSFLSMILHTVQFSYDMKRGMYITYSTTHLIASHHTVILSWHYQEYLSFQSEDRKVIIVVSIWLFKTSIVGVIVEWLTCDAMTCFNGCWRRVCACIVHQYQHKKFNGTQSVYSWHTPVSNKG